MIISEIGHGPPADTPKFCGAGKPQDFSSALEAAAAEMVPAEEEAAADDRAALKTAAVIKMASAQPASADMCPAAVSGLCLSAAGQLSAGGDSGKAAGLMAGIPEKHAGAGSQARAELRAEPPAAPVNLAADGLHTAEVIRQAGIAEYAALPGPSSGKPALTGPSSEAPGQTDAATELSHAVKSAAAELKPGESSRPHGEALNTAGVLSEPAAAAGGEAALPEKGLSRDFPGTDGGVTAEKAAADVIPSLAENGPDQKGFAAERNAKDALPPPDGGDAAAPLSLQDLTSGGTEGGGLKAAGQSGEPEPVIREMRILRRPGGDQINEIRLRLEPDVLGEIVIKVSRTDGKVTGSILVENSAVREMLENRLPYLRERLGEHGVKLEQMQVSLGSYSEWESRERLPEKKYWTTLRQKSGAGAAQAAAAAAYDRQRILDILV